MPIHRRVFCAASAAFLVAPVRAQFKVEISGVGATQLPIAIVRFRDEDRSGQSPSAIIRADLERSGAFRGVDNSATLDETSQPQWGEWRARTEEQLAGLTVELIRSRAPLFAEPLPAAALEWVTALAATGNSPRSP